MKSKRVPHTKEFQFVGGALTLDFINTVGNRLGDQREYLRSPQELKRWIRLAGLMGNQREISISRMQLAELLSIREELYQLFKPAAGGKTLPKPAVERLNRRLAAVMPYRQLAPADDGFAWGWRLRSRDAARLEAYILFDAAELVTSGRFRKIRECAGGPCGWLFLDRSQAGRRRWCSMEDCGNRDKVRRYYRRSTDENQFIER